MNETVLEENNIQNLKNLFKTMGATSHIYDKDKTLYISKTWPNRAWADYNYNEQDIQALVSKVAEKNIPYTISLCDKKDESNILNENILGKNGFKITFEQIAMVLDVKNNSDKQNSNLKFNYINTQNEIEMWVKIASESFSKQINKDVIKKILNNENIQLLLAYKDNKAVGTALVFLSSDVIGVHLVGVPSENRGQGIARDIMIETINYAKKQKVSFLTLQASSLGLGIYKRLGFKEQFVLKNYMKK